jgi:hypothetical protein
LYDREAILMAKAKDAEKDAAGRDEQMARLARGEQPDGGWCIDFDHPETVYRCSDEETAVAEGKISVSIDRSKVLDLATGEVTEREADFRRANFGVVEMSGEVPSTSSANVTGNTGGTSSGGGANG